MPAEADLRVSDGVDLVCFVGVGGNGERIFGGGVIWCEVGDLCALRVRINGMETATDAPGAERVARGSEYSADFNAGAGSISRGSGGGGAGSAGGGGT